MPNAAIQLALDALRGLRTDFERLRHDHPPLFSRLLAGPIVFHSEHLEHVHYQNGFNDNCEGCLFANGHPFLNKPEVQVDYYAGHPAFDEPDRGAHKKRSRSAYHEYVRLAAETRRLLKTIPAEHGALPLDLDDDRLLSAFAKLGRTAQHGDPVARWTFLLHWLSWLNPVGFLFGGKHRLLGIRKRGNDPDAPGELATALPVLEADVLNRLDPIRASNERRDSSEQPAEPDVRSDIESITPSAGQT